MTTQANQLIAYASSLFTAGYSKKKIHDLVYTDYLNKPECDELDLSSTFKYIRLLFRDNDL